jgi:heat shock protein HtpX
MISNTFGTFTNQLKTVVLLAALGGLLVAVGGLLGGTSGMAIALVFAIVMNVGVYWFSDKLALRANGARPLQPGELPAYERIVRDLSARAGLPVPALYVIDRPEANAFATGRSPNHAAVAVTTGILSSMDERQLRGVLAHELSHITNRDMLIGTIAATIGGAISFLGNMALWSSFFGGGDDDNVPAPVLLMGAILAPIAATIIQLAVSRSREYGADRSGAGLTNDPEGLAQALERLDLVNQAARANRGGLFGRGRQQPQPVPAATAHLYTVNPLSADGVGSLFSTHPPIGERVRRLRSMRSV